MRIILIDAVRKRWLHAFFKNQRFYFEINLGVSTFYSRLAWHLDTTTIFCFGTNKLKIYSFQAAGKNKIIAKNAFLPDIDISIKSSASDVTKFFA